MIELSLTSNKCPTNMKYIRIFDSGENSQFIVQKESKIGKILSKSPFLYENGDKTSQKALKMSVLTTIVNGYYDMGFKHLRYAPKEGELAECYKIFNK